MYKNYRVLCVIPARGGSKGLPRKNIKNLLGRPLISYSIEHAKKSSYVDRLVVSTDDEEIAGQSIKYGAEVPFIRPIELAGDDVGAIDVLLHAVGWIEKEESAEYDIIILLHATSPLRTPDDIDKCVETMIEGQVDNVFSVTESSRNPYFNMVECDGKTIRLVKEGSFTTRQSSPKVFDINASVYVWWTEKLKNGKSIFLDNSSIYEMPKERSVDIDDEIDFQLAEMLLNEKPSK